MLFTFPSRYSFTIGLTGVFSLAGWSRPIQAGFLVPRPTQGSAGRGRRSRMGLSPAAAELSRSLRSAFPLPCRGPTTPTARRHAEGLGSSPFARHYLGNHCCFLFLPLLRCFSSRRSPLIKGNGSSIHWVAPFGDPGIRGHLHLPRAYRSLSRPSSPSRAKASACCPFLLLSFCSYSVLQSPCGDIQTCSIKLRVFQSCD